MDREGKVINFRKERLKYKVRTFFSSLNCSLKNTFCWHGKMLPPGKGNTPKKGYNRMRYRKI